MNADLTVVIADLQRHRAQLAMDLQRVDAALSALLGNGGRDAQTTTTGVSLIERVAEMFDEHPKTHFSAESALEMLRASGYSSDAGDPLNAMRTSLSRLARRGDIVRVERGQYKKRLAPTVANDPWAVDLDASEEPPF